MPVVEPQPVEAAGDLEMEPGINAEMLVDLVKESAAPGIWEGAHTIERTGARELLIHTHPRVHRQIERLLKRLEADEAQFSASVSLFAVDDPHVGEELSDEAAAKLRRLEAVTLSAQAEQIVSAVTGSERSLVMAFDGRKPVVRSVREGMAVELWGVPSGEGLHVKARIGFRRILGVDELKTPQGAVQMPQLYEADVAEERRVSFGKPIVLARIGPLPSEAGLPPFLLVVGRFTRK